MPKRAVSLVLALILLITPMGVLAGHETNTVHGTVFSDTDHDGVFDQGVEGGIDGVTVELFVAGETVSMDSDTTAGGGAYEFTEIEDGDYEVKVVDIADTIDSSPNPVAFTVDSTTLIPTIDFGKVPVGELGSISGTVYDDQDRSGDVSPGDVGIEFAVLKILDAKGSEIVSTQTDSDGNYIFEDLLAREYTVVEVDPSPYYSVTPNQQMVTLGVGEALEDIDFFDFIPAEGEFPRLDLMLMKFFDISLLEFQALREMEGFGYGNIAKAYFIAMLSDTALGEILGMRETMGWGNIMKEFLGYAGLKGYNLGLIVSGRTVPNAIQKLINSCASIETPEQVQELFATGASHGAVKKACKLADEVDGSFDTLVSALGLLKAHSQKEVRAMLMDGAANQETNSQHGPPACKGKNKNDEGCN